MKVNKRTLRVLRFNLGDFPQYSPLAGGIDCHVGVNFSPGARVQLFQFTFYLKEIAVSFN